MYKYPVYFHKIFDDGKTWEGLQEEPNVIYYCYWCNPPHINETNPHNNKITNENTLTANNDEELLQILLIVEINGIRSKQTGDNVAQTPETIILALNRGDYPE